MISPFAGFFYSVFNPVLLKVAANPLTRWLSAFFLPHMVVPPGWFLQSVRVMGSVLFVVGLALFFICAGQIYTAKFRKKGAVRFGLNAYIRHPQYLALGLAGLGLAILWPRFMTVVFWLLMTVAYYILAKDEERRMLTAHGDTYQPYMKGTGMFLPQSVEKFLVLASLPGKLTFGTGAGSGMTRRLIFLSLEGVATQSPADFFGINALRVPQFMADVDVHELRLIEVRELPHGSGWGSVPTPTF